MTLFYVRPVLSSMLFYPGSPLSYELVKNCNTNIPSKFPVLNAIHISAAKMLLAYQDCTDGRRSVNAGDTTFRQLKDNS